MAGPTQQITRKIIIQPGEARTEYNPAALAHTVQNLEMTLQGTLKSVVGPTILRIGSHAHDPLFPAVDVAFPDSSYPEGGVAGHVVGSLKNDLYWNTGRPHSIFQAPLNSGSATQLLYRFGDRLYRFTGSQAENSADELLLTGLSNSSLPDFPDQYVVIDNRIIWTNGVDRARVISFDGNVVPLGFDERPSPPDVLGPQPVPYEDVAKFYPNSFGYSWPGFIGTAGDSFRGQAGALLAGKWYYHAQYEDIYGNLSPFSAASSAISMQSNQADPVSFEDFDDAESLNQGVEIDDLTRRFIVRTSSSAPEHTAAVHIYRTPNTLQVDQKPRLLARIPGSRQVVFDDSHSDADLGSTWERNVKVPVFRVAAAHQGRLIIGNTTTRPGIVRRSEPGFPGTFGRHEFVFPDSGGAEVTAVADHRGILLAFTENCVYSLQDFSNPVPLSQGIGCVAPGSVKALKDGTLMWLGRDGFYGMREAGVLQRLSAPIDLIMRRHLNRARMRVASAVVDAETGEYRCALAPAGSTHNNLLLCFDGQFWRRQKLGIHIAGMVSTDDWLQTTMAIGTDLEAEYDVNVSFPRTVGSPSFNENLDFSRVFVLGRQTSDYFGPSRSIVYRSGWLRFSDEGMMPAHVRSMYIGMLDAWNGNATMRIYKNGSWAPVDEMTDVRLMGVDDGSNIVNDTAASFIIGSSQLHNPRLCWREIPVGLRNVTSWAFELELTGSMRPGAANELGRMHLAAFAFDTSIATQGLPYGRLPRRDDI